MMSEAGMSTARLDLFSVEVVVDGLEAEVVSLFMCACVHACMSVCVCVYRFEEL